MVIDALRRVMLADALPNVPVFVWAVYTRLLCRLMFAVRPFALTDPPFIGVRWFTPTPKTDASALKPEFKA